MPYKDPQKAKECALADNRTAEVGLQWDAARLDKLRDEMPEAAKRFFQGYELNQLINPDKSDVNQEWEGMPEFEQDAVEVFHTVKVHFLSESDVLAFAELLGQTVNEKTTYIYYPKQIKENLKRFRVLDES